MNIPLPIRNLANTDRKLLDLVLDSGFDFRQVVTKAPNAHPAQQSLVAFLLWFGQPHIKEATEILLSLFHRLEHFCATARQARARVVLEKSLTLIHSITPSSIPDHPDPIQAEKARREAHALARESRLIAARLTPASALKNPDAPIRPKNSPSSTTSRARQPAPSSSPASSCATSSRAASSPNLAHPHPAPDAATPPTSPTHTGNPDLAQSTFTTRDIDLGPNLTALFRQDESLSHASA
jgi:hypothetical protein